MKRILISLLLLIFIPLCAKQSPLSLKEKFATAEPGDFVVTAQQSNYSLLCIRSITPEVIIFEEISIPSAQIDLKSNNWKQWVLDKAPGHTSWTLHEIDRETGNLIECFSCSKNGWLHLDRADQFLTRLFSLPLTPIPLGERKKIGPKPTNGEIDHRAPWNPPLVIEGKKIEKPSFDALKTRWPDDGTLLSLCFIELYFAKAPVSLPFPCWLEVQSPHYTFKMRTIDAGKGLVSPLSGPMPHRPPRILSKAQREDNVWKLLVQTPIYFQKLQLFVVDVTSAVQDTIPVRFTSRTGANQEEMILEIPHPFLKDTLKSGHRYQWVIIPEKDGNCHVQSEETFLWN